MNDNYIENLFFFSYLSNTSRKIAFILFSQLDAKLFFLNSGFGSDSNIKCVVAISQMNIDTFPVHSTLEIFYKTSFL